MAQKLPTLYNETSQVDVLVPSQQSRTRQTNHYVTETVVEIPNVIVIETPVEVEIGVPLSSTSDQWCQTLSLEQEFAVARPIREVV